MLPIAQAAAMMKDEASAEIGERLTEEQRAKFADLARRVALFSVQSNAELIEVIQAAASLLAETPGELDQLGAELGMYFTHLLILESMKIASEHVPVSSQPM